MGKPVPLHCTHTAHPLFPHTFTYTLLPAAPAFWVHFSQPCSDRQTTAAAAAGPSASGASEPTPSLQRGDEGREWSIKHSDTHTGITLRSSKQDKHKRGILQLSMFLGVVDLAMSESCISKPQINNFYLYMCPILLPLTSSHHFLLDCKLTNCTVTQYSLKTALFFGSTSLGT